VLKGPQIASHLENFSRVFPQARFLYLHRDPYRVLTSFCTLLDIVNGPFLADRDYQLQLDTRESHCLKRMRRVYASMASFESAHPTRVLNMSYVDLLNSPADEIDGVYRAAGYAPDARQGEKIREFLAQQKAGRRTQPHQQIADHGYTREQVEGDPEVAAYLQRYKVVLEHTRNTG
jgi:hypothetical protein